MNNILRFDREYTIPVYFSIDEFSTQNIEGQIIIKKGRLPYLEANIYNDDYVIPDHITNIPMIYCPQKSGGKILLLINNTVNPITSFSGSRRSFRIDFQYIINGFGNIKNKNDLYFKKIILSFENLYSWTSYKHYTAKNIKNIIEVNVNNICNLNTKVRFIKSERNVKHDNIDNRITEKEVDTKIEINTKKGKFSLSDVKLIVHDFEALLTCITGKSCFCLDITLGNRRGRSKYSYFYNIFIPEKQCEPKFKLNNTFEAFNPYLLDHPDELEKILNNYFIERESINKLLYKLSSTILYEDRFLYDVKFHYLCTLVETANRLLFKSNEISVDLEKLKESVFKVIPDEAIVNNIISAIPFVLKGTFKQKIRKLESYQYKDSKIVSFNSQEVNFIKDTRNLISHGESWNNDKNFNIQEVMEKLNILLLYSLWKKIGLPVELIKENVLRSFTTYQFPINDEIIKYEKYDKVYITHKEYNRASKYNSHSFLVLEKHNNNIYFNQRYTSFLNNDYRKLKYYSNVGCYLKCYYNQDAITFEGYKQNVYLINKNNFNEKKMFSQYFLINIKSSNRNEAYKVIEPLIPISVNLTKDLNKSIIFHYRKYRNMSLNEVAQITGLSPRTITNYEVTHKVPNKENYKKIMSCLGTDFHVDEDI